ncbi:two-component sensor histidine kinase [Azospirillum fermentarium]|uniref:sensor histidine kinase n=1 Tax=Azospirillum fermentarium TaxID=1233114 RepID=UPI002226FD42|nr:sensor histidine kinase [Azospirillum fermentarium]MCW2246608.1 two-component sensor histidine kinase [Azospirillum fermentarium]
MDLSDPALLLSILDLMPTPALVAEWPSRRILCVNAAAEDAFGGCLMEHAILKASDPVFGAVCADGGIDAVGSSGRREQWSAVIDPATDVCWDLACSPLTGGGRQIAGVLLTAQDVTSRERLAAAEAAHVQAVREANHRAKNTLQLITSLLTLQTLSTPHPDVRRTLQDCCGRIGIIAQLHQKARLEHGAPRVDFAAYLHDMANDVTAAGRGCPVVTESDAALLPAETAVSLALIINELVNNAARHAYGAGEGGVVSVTLRAGADGGRQLVVSDRGIGIPAECDPFRQGGMGLKMTRAFVSQLRGRIAIDRTGPGVAFVIDLPAP